jgi:hypothetical protein
MKSTIIPSVRVAPELREQIDQTEFVARGVRSLAQARASGHCVEADDAIARLRTRLASARARQARAAR